MLYLLFFGVAGALFYCLDNYKIRIGNIAWLFWLLAIFALSYLPALQYGVGADYFNYYSFAAGSNEFDFYERNREYIFYYLLVAVNSLNLNPQVFFMLVSFLFSGLIVNALRILHRNNYQVFWVFLILAVATGMFHNSMNVIRNYVAVAFFVNSFLYKSERKYFLSMVFLICSVFSHQTAMVMALAILMPFRLYRILFHYRAVVFVVVVFIFLSGLLHFLFINLVNVLLPQYDHYFETRQFMQSASLINVLTKLYYMPLYVWFLVYSYKKKFWFNYYDKNLIGFWLLVGQVYLSLAYALVYFRVFHYTVFFSIIPIYFVISLTKSEIAKALVVLYLTLPYVLKVVVFPSGEYAYHSILFGP